MASTKQPDLYKVDIHEDTTTLLLGTLKSGINADVLSDETIEIVDTIDIPNHLLVAIIEKLIAVGVATQLKEKIDLGFNVTINSEEKTISVTI